MLLDCEYSPHIAEIIDRMFDQISAVETKIRIIIVKYWFNGKCEIGYISGKHGFIKQYTQYVNHDDIQLLKPILSDLSKLIRAKRPAMQTCLIHYDKSLKYLTICENKMQVYIYDESLLFKQFVMK